MFCPSEIAYVGVARIFAAGVSRHVTKTVYVCRSVPRSVLQSLVTSLVLTRLDYGNANLASIPLYLLKRLQSVLNSAARQVFLLSRYDHITPLVRQLAALVEGKRAN